MGVDKERNATKYKYVLVNQTQDCMSETQKSDNKINMIRPHTTMIGPPCPRVSPLQSDLTHRDRGPTHIATRADTARSRLNRFTRESSRGDRSLCALPPSLPPSLSIATLTKFSRHLANDLFSMENDRRDATIREAIDLAARQTRQYQ